MASKLTDTVTVVTGASSGIGRATALHLAERGGAVAVVARREAALQRLVHECEAAGGRALALPADVADADAIEQVATEVLGSYGKLDAWVNNASVNQYARFTEAPLEEFRRVLDVNVMGYVHGARAAIPFFREQGRGVLVNVSSVLAKLSAPYQAAYVVSKHAVHGLSKALRQELTDAPDIHVCEVQPGAIDTPFFQHAANHIGRQAKAPNPTIDARRVAEAIAGVIASPQREVAVGYSARAGILQQTVLPGLTEKAAAAGFGEDQFADAPQEPTSGNVFAPMAEGEDIDGGWRSESGRSLGKALVGLAGAAAAAGVAVARNRNER